MQLEHPSRQGTHSNRIGILLYEAIPYTIFHGSRDSE